MDIQLSNRLALVTGASSGIGKAAALMLAQAGAEVAVHYFSGRDRAEEVAGQIEAAGGKAKLFQADVTSVEEIERLVSDVRAAFGKPVDILFNNAGHMLERKKNAEMTEALYEQVMDLNVKSTVFMCRAVIPGMKESGGGKIINMASLAAHSGGGNGSSVYAASKAAVIAYSKGLAKELAPHNIYVNVVSPGFIGQTGFHSKVTSEEARRAAVNNTPLGREGTPEDVAGAVVYLASDLSGFITGETIEINGGAFMR